MKTVRFKCHPKAQVRKVLYPDGDIALISYNTMAAYCTSDGWVRVFGLWSATTRRHIGWFMKELGLDYQTAKCIYENGFTINRFTGEVQNILPTEN